MNHTFKCISRSDLFTTTPSGNHVYACSNSKVNQETCLIKGSSASHAICEDCKHRQESEEDLDIDSEWKFVTIDQFAKDSLALANYIPSDCSGIAGIARSGILPASILATHLQLPLYSLRIGDHGPELTELKPQAVHRGGKKELKTQSGPIFVVDDTVHSGGCMTIIRAITSSINAIYSAVYVTPEFAHLTDCYAKALKTPHFLEWNIFNNGFVCGGPADSFLHGGLAFDFDGVLCLDPKPGEEHTDPNVWIANLRPTHMLPRHYSIPLIITMRLEAWRKPTEDWLERYRILYDKLEMCQASSIAERDSNFLTRVIEHKAEKFRASSCYMMIESDEGQARLIQEYSKKPVLCTATRKIIQ